MVRRGLVASAAILVAFHAWLFAGQILSGELANPGLLLQWTIAGALTWALWRLRRSGESVVRSRKAVAIWLLAALLHAPAVADGLENPGAPALPEVVATIATSAAGVAVAVGFLLLLVVAARRARTTRTPAFHVVVAARVVGAHRFGSHVLLAPRPPPLG